MTDILIARLRQRAADPRRATDQSGRFLKTSVAPVLDEHLVARAEECLRQQLPPLLRDAYRYVANGGFGPGYGIFPLLPASEPTGEESAVGLHTAFCSFDPNDPAWSWPINLLPFCDWGCAIRTCVDCSSAEGTVVTFDPNVRGVGEPMSTAFAVTHSSLHGWFSDWIAGVKLWDVMFEPDPGRAQTGINPLTKEPFVMVPTKLRRE